ncbi:MAG TPA: xanthine dehydrogenase family protein subunit M [bacterium]|nr:xanthine dehydrogenase family protein subunit M [bacterium]HOL48425.1 xanthine dehydrogenase family protein subunit M [bacterium]HPQ20043.1 xanthine dehydrogenase family protein subunit M [bacterium]
MDIKIEKVNTIKEAVKLHFTSKEKNVFYLAGGTDLMVQAKDNLITPALFIDISEIKELKQIKKEKNNLFIGSLVTHSEIENNKLCQKYFPALVQSASEVGATQIKNRGTIGGNVANASPAADTLSPLYAYNALVILYNHQGKEKKVPINEFVIGPKKTNLKKGEIIKGFLLPIDTSLKSAFKKVGPRKLLTISKVHCALAVIVKKEKFEYVSIAIGSVGPTIIRAKKAEEYLIGKEANNVNINEAAKIATSEIKPIDDIRSEAEYRKDLTYSMVKDLLLEVCK